MAADGLPASISAEVASATIAGSAEPARLNTHIGVAGVGCGPAFLTPSPTQRKGLLRNQQRAVTSRCGSQPARAQSPIGRPKRAADSRTAKAQLEIAADQRLMDSDDESTRANSAASAARSSDREPASISPSDRATPQAFRRAPSGSRKQGLADCRVQALPEVIQIDRLAEPRATTLDQAERDRSRQGRAEIARRDEADGAQPSRRRPRRRARRSAADVSPSAARPTSWRRLGSHAASLNSERRPTYSLRRFSRGPATPRSCGMVTPSLSLPTIRYPFSARNSSSASEPSGPPPSRSAAVSMASNKAGAASVGTEIS